MRSPAPDMPPAALALRALSLVAYHLSRLHVRLALETMNSSRAVWVAPSAVSRRCAPPGDLQ
jgi:hypothetical protein